MTPTLTSRLTVNLTAIANNWRSLAATHQGPTAAVVKADAYGLGATEIAPHLHQAGARFFFVAHLGEALALRPHLPAAPIGVLNGFDPSEAGAYTTHHLVPVLGNLPEIKAYQAHAAHCGHALPAILHIDTGLNRLGLSPAELGQIAETPGLLAGIAWAYAMTHLVSAESPADPINARQLVVFNAACARLPAMPRSIANSSGIYLGADFRSDLARPGAALYGINPTPQAQNPMQTVLRLTAPVLQIRDIAKGEGVGYNSTWRATRPTRVATVAYGYADGYHRGASNRAEAAFDGARLPLIGRVSMDLTTFDATDQPTLRPGDHLELIGPAIPPDEVAGWANTNGYEILTSLKHRANRTYEGRLGGQSLPPQTPRH